MLNPILNDQSRHGRFLAGKDAIVEATSLPFHCPFCGCHRCCRHPCRFLLLKIQLRTMPWLPCLPWRPWFKLIGILVGIPMLPDFSNRKVEGAEGIFKSSLVGFPVGKADGIIILQEIHWNSDKLIFGSGHLTIAKAWKSCHKYFKDKVWQELYLVIYIRGMQSRCLHNKKVHKSTTGPHYVNPNPFCLVEPSCLEAPLFSKHLF